MKEGIPEHKVVSQEREGSISRRDFLKKAGVGVAAFSVTMPLSEVLYARSVEIEKGDTWSEGVDALRQEVFSKNKESSALYIVPREGVGYWTHPKEGMRKVTSEGMSDSANTQIDVVHSEIENGAKEVVSAHTHPLKIMKDSLGLSESDLHEMKNGIRVPPSIPPGKEDILSLIYLHKVAFREGVQIKKLVIDPRGGWTYCVDSEHPFVRDYGFYVEWYKKLQSAIALDPVAQEIMKENSDFPHYRLSLHPRNREISRDVLEFGDKLKKIEESFNKKHYSVLKSLYYDIPTYIEQSLRDDKDTALKLDALIKMYQSAGVRVSFDPFEQLAKTDK